MVRRTGRRPTKVMWIFCEGEKTERGYFNQLRRIERISRLSIKVKKSSRTNAKGIVNHAIKFIENDKNFEQGDLIFCVFDRDSNTPAQLREAKELADNANIQIAFSNPCFEYWLLCHYQYYINQLTHEELEEKLSREMRGYSKTDPNLYNKTKDKIEDAKRHSNQIQQKHTGEGTELISCDSNPITLVNKLIQELDQFRD